MNLSSEIQQYSILLFIAFAVGGMIFAIAYPYFSGSAQTAKRVAQVTRKDGGAKSGGFRARLMEDSKDSRRRQIQESLQQFEQTEKKKRKKVTLRSMIMQAGLDISLQAYFMASAIVGALFSIGILISGVPMIVAVVGGLVGALGLPRWFLSYLRRRRQEVFLTDFADAIDVMVRGLKAGLPVTDAMKVIATESGPPVGPEFMEVVEGQRVGITIDQGIERMYERMPLPEVNFLSIVLAIQSKTGGNLAEALNNLSVVLRDRKKMKGKIKSVSQEAKASAAIIGSLPFCIMGGLMVLNPEYLNPLFYTKLGNIMLAGSAMWMTTGVLVMRKMINFDF